MRQDHAEPSTASLQTPVADVHARSAAPVAHTAAVREMFDRISPTYDLLNRGLSLGLDVAWRRRAVRELLRALPAGDVLDLCAGTLDLSAEICRTDVTRHVHAVDLSPEMLARGAGKVNPARVSTQVGDATSLAIESRSLAGAISGFGVRNTTQPAAVASEMLRVLVPGGRFVTLEFFRPTRTVTRAFHATYASVLLPSVGRMVSGDRGAYDYLARSMAGFLTRTEYESTLERAGFTAVRGYDLLFGIASIVSAEKPVVQS